MNFELSNVVESNKKWPTTFHIASKAERRSLKIGDSANLHFVFVSAEGTGEEWVERMWVKVTEVDFDRATGTTNYGGRLNNQPFAGEATLGEEVRFRPRHVAMIQVAPCAGNPA